MSVELLNRISHSPDNPNDREYTVIIEDRYHIQDKMSTDLRLTQQN